MSLQKIQSFDAEWYNREYPDVALSGLTPLEHFRRFGLILNRKPCADWSDGDAGELQEPGRQDKKDISGLPLVPANDLMEVAEGSWSSKGPDPFFLLDLNRMESFSIGWYRFSLEIEGERNTALAKFYLDTGAGFNENDTISIPYRSGELVQRLYHIDGMLNALRFDPQETEGNFSIKRLDITYCEPNGVADDMLARISALHPDHVGKTRKQLLIDLIGNEFPDPYDVPVPLQQAYSETFRTSQSHISYEDWMANVEAPSLPDQAEVYARLSVMKYKPLISVVIPTYNTPTVYLQECIDSVLEQSYPYWELCIADDASTDTAVQDTLRRYEALDERIRVVYREQNGHISAASNSALELAAGDFVALVDHDDKLAEHALLFMAEAINHHRNAKVLYSDEDKIDRAGLRFDPHFKSDWNPDLFFSQNYVSHLGLYQRDLLLKIGGFRKGVEGSQDQDLLLRCLPHLSMGEVIHVPRVLYHWRTVEGSTALASDEKSYTGASGLKALRDYFASIGRSDVSVEPGLASNTYRVRWPLPQPEPLTSLLIPTRDRKAITEVAVRSILEKTTYKNYEIIIIDNGSVEQETLDFFDQIQAEDQRVRVVRYDHPFNYSAINNFGVEHARGSLIGLINNDVEVIAPEWLTEMVSQACRPEIGCVGAKLLYSNGTIQHAGVITGLGGVAGHSHKHFPGDHPGYFHRLVLIQNLSAVTAACLIVRRSVYEEVGGLNESDLKVAFNDVDFCLKVQKAGYRNLWSPYAQLFHHESISRGAEDNPEKISRFASEIDYMKRTWPAELHNDRYYNVNLTKDHENFAITNRAN